jgi:hypothetical protein
MFQGASCGGFPLPHESKELGDHWENHEQYWLWRLNITHATSGCPTWTFVLGCHSSNVVFLFLGDDWWHGKAFWTLRMCKGLWIAEVDGLNTLKMATFDAMAPDGNYVWQPCWCEVAWIGTSTLNGWLDVASGVDCRGVDTRALCLIEGWGIGNEQPKRDNNCHCIVCI